MHTEVGANCQPRWSVVLSIDRTMKFQVREIAEGVHNEAHNPARTLRAGAPCRATGEPSQAAHSRPLVTAGMENNPSQARNGFVH